MKEIKPSDLDNILYTTKTKSEYDIFKQRYCDAILSYDDNVLCQQLPITEASMTQPLKHIYSCAPVMFVTAYKSILTLERNKERNKELLIDIIDKGYFFIPFSGYWTDYDRENNVYADTASYESSFMVVGIKRGGKIVDFSTFREFALELCIKYDQDCVLIGKADEYSLDRKYKDISITFGFLNQKDELDNVFTELHFDNADRVKEIHDYFIETKNKQKENFGFAHTTDIKNKNTFRLMDKEESQARKEYYDIQPTDKKTGMIITIKDRDKLSNIKSDWVVSNLCLNKRDSIMNMYQLNPEYIKIGRENGRIV